MAAIISMAVLFTTIITIAADVVIDDSKYDAEFMTILPGGIKLCSRSSSSQEEILSLNETAYIFINYTMLLSFESTCFKKKHIIMFTNNGWYTQVNRKSRLQIKFTTDGLVIDSKDDIVYRKIDLTNINSEISNDVDCLEKSQIIEINVNNISRVCNPLELLNILGYQRTTPEPRYNPSGSRYTINFPYIIILMMILVGKAICGYAIYKRRQARFITFTSQRLVEHYGNVSPIGRGTIIVAANGANYPRQPTIYLAGQTLEGLPSKPLEDLPPNYDDLQQQTDINPPGYEDACKNQSVSPPVYGNYDRDNAGFQIETETSSVNHITESFEVNRLSPKDGSVVSSELN